MRIGQLMLLEWQQESANTRKILERVPTEQLSWRPHEKSMTIGRLATHIAELPIWFSRVLEADEFDFASVAFNPYTAESNEVLLNLFDTKFAASIPILEAADDVVMNRIWTLKRSGQVMLQLPRKVVLPNLCFEPCVSSSRAVVSVFAIARHSGAGHVWSVGRRAENIGVMKEKNQSFSL